MSHSAWRRAARHGSHLTESVGTRVSTSPVQPQDAFEQLARISLAEHSMDTVMQTIAELTKRTLPGASEVSVTLVDRGEARTVASTGPLAQSLDERQYERGYGPCRGSIEGAEVVVDSTSTDGRWPDYMRLAREQGAGSSVSVPVPVQREVSAAINVYSTRERAFDPDSITLATTFASYAGVALANMHLYEAQAQVAEHLQAAMKSRAVVEQAKGMLMAQRRCTSQQAFDLLVKASQRDNRKLRDIAQKIVDSAPR